MQLAVSTRLGHALPPCLELTIIERVRDFDPAPHDLVQVENPPKLLTSHGIAHAYVLQLRVSVECGHATPPCCGRLFVRLRIWEPVAHDLVQVDHTPNAPVWQSIAHGLALQLRVSARYGQV